MIVKMGMWKYAPFRAAIVSSVNILNDFIKGKGWDAHYEVVFIAPSKNEFPVVDMIMLDGGEDVNPETYGERNLFSFFNRKRDEEELDILRFYSSQGYPVRFSGVCRGHQLLNVFYGGTLWQDINKQLLDKSAISHPSPHKVTLNKQNTLYGKELDITRFLSNLEPFYVSSLHHQAIRNPGKNLLMSLIWKHQRGYNRLIEGMESKEGTVRGVQSHPEFKSFATDGNLFSYLAHLDYFLGGFMEPANEEDIPKSKLAEVSNKKEMREITLDRALRPSRDYEDVLVSSRPLRGIRIVREEPPPDFDPDEEN